MALSLPPGVPPSQTPVALPPADTESNFVDPPSLYGLVIGVCSAMMVLTFIFVSIRLFVAFHKHHKLNIDDYCCTAAMVLSFTYVGLTFSLPRQVYRHSWNSPLSTYDAKFLKISYAAEMILGPMMFLAKSSLLLLYLRIFGLKKATRYTVYFALAFSFCLYWIGIPLFSYYCAPSPGKEWPIVSMGAKRCRTSKLLGTVQGPLNMVLDALIISLPVPVVLGLQMSVRKRAAVLVVFLTGILAVAASIIGLVYRVKIFLTDDVWDSAIVYICITVETDISIICSSMPSFASFLKTYVANSPHLSSLRERVASHLAISKTKLVSQPARSNRPRFKDDGTFRPQRFRVGQDSKWGGRLDVFMANFSSVHTNISTADHASMEEGIIMESLSIEQSAQENDVACRV